jgi:hypothetical protein
MALSRKNRTRNNCPTTAAAELSSLLRNSSFLRNNVARPCVFHSSEKEELMRKLALGIFAAATLLAASAPAMAQVGFYAGPGGFGVGVGAPYYGPRYYDYYGGPGVYVAPDWRYHHRWHHWR